MDVCMHAYREICYVACTYVGTCVRSTPKALFALLFDPIDLVFLV